MKSESLSFRDRFGILLEKRLSSVAGLKYTILYGKSQLRVLDRNLDYHKTKIVGLLYKTPNTNHIREDFDVILLAPVEVRLKSNSRSLNKKAIELANGFTDDLEEAIKDLTAFHLISSKDSYDGDLNIVKLRIIITEFVQTPVRNRGGGRSNTAAPG